MCEVKIPLSRYDELLRSESRVQTAVRQIINQQYINTEDILRILGTEEALLEADRIHKEEMRQKAEWKEKYGFSQEAEEKI